MTTTKQFLPNQFISVTFSNNYIHGKRNKNVSGDYIYACNNTFDSFEVHNVEMQVAEVGTKYDFSGTKQWVDLQDQIDELKEKQKEVEKFCKGIKNKTITVDEETGESFEFYPPAKSSTTSIKKTIL
jgi:hypothetical protein